MERPSEKVLGITAAQLRSFPRRDSRGATQWGDPEQGHEAWSEGV